MLFQISNIILGWLDSNSVGFRKMWAVSSLFGDISIVETKYLYVGLCIYGSIEFIFAFSHKIDTIPTFPGIRGIRGIQKQHENTVYTTLLVSGGGGLYAGLTCRLRTLCGNLLLSVSLFDTDHRDVWLICRRTPMTLRNTRKAFPKADIGIIYVQCP